MRVDCARAWCAPSKICPVFKKSVPDTSAEPPEPTLDPTRAPDYYNRARALFALERFAEAYKDVQKFLAREQRRGPKGNRRPTGHAAATGSSYSRPDHRRWPP